MNLLLTILAQDAAGKSGFDPRMLIGIVLMIGVFYLVLFRGTPKTRKKRAEMLANLKKNDRILTRGGILGTIVGIKDNQVVLKVDETTNTKMTFLKDAVWQIVQEDTELSMEENR